MKKKFIGLFMVLVTMIGIPLFTVKNNIYNEAVSVFADKAQKNTETKSSVITGITAAKFRKEYSEEALKAIAIILNTNYKADKNSFDLKDSEDYLSKEEFCKKYKKGEEYYSLIEKCVSEVTGKYIEYKGEAVYIPCFYLSKGYTESSEKYPYIRDSASPWDCINKNYKSSKNVNGVSLNGINSLCNAGLSRKKALEWYLQDIKIAAAK